GETCTAGHQCKSGKCGLGRCYTPDSVALGGTCYVDAACKVGKCSSIDGTKGTCVCKKDSDCGPGKWCDAGLDFKKNTCKNKLDSGEVCGTVGELNVGHRCKSGQCKVSGVSTKLKCK
ncbi:MAG TPA: Dickkopf N-terminal cysteine-rich domain-containing protein, partial [Nannocystis sp.]